jgi:hypothetical protein
VSPSDRAIRRDALVSAGARFCSTAVYCARPQLCCQDASRGSCRQALARVVAASVIYRHQCSRPDNSVFRTIAHVQPQRRGRAAKHLKCFARPTTNSSRPLSIVAATKAPSSIARAATAPSDSRPECAGNVCALQGTRETRQLGPIAQPSEITWMTDSSGGTPQHAASAEPSSTAVGMGTGGSAATARGQCPWPIRALKDVGRCRASRHKLSKHRRMVFARPAILAIGSSRTCGADEVVRVQTTKCGSRPGVDHVLGTGLYDLIVDDTNDFSVEAAIDLTAGSQRGQVGFRRPTTTSADMWRICRDSQSNMAQLVDPIPPGVIRSRHAIPRPGPSAE